VERMQAEIDRLRDAIHDLRSRTVVLEVTAKNNASVLERLEDLVSRLARRDEIEDAVTKASQDTRQHFWRTWQGVLTTAGALVVLTVSVLSLWDRFF
jgi:uncharacterized protein YigA (DUF484 family)